MRLPCEMHRIRTRPLNRPRWNSNPFFAKTLLAHGEQGYGDGIQFVRLADAIGRPVWTLVPAVADWRWMRDTDRSPWYPSMRLYRQPRPGAWAEVVDRVAADLRALTPPPAR